MKLARENAASLLADAKLLFDSGSHARSAVLAILALEEMGKIPVLRDILTAPDSDSLRNGWTAYRDHEAKNWMALFFQYARPGAQLEDLHLSSRRLKTTP